MNSPPSSPPLLIHLFLRLRSKRLSQMRLKKMSKMRLKRPSYMRLRRGPSMMRRDIVGFRGQRCFSACCDRGLRKQRSPLDFVT